MSPAARGLATLAIAAAGGIAFFLLNLPLPWVLGSLAATAVWTRLSRFEPRLPMDWRNYAMVAVGTMLGTGFTPDVVSRAGRWGPSLLAMTALSVAFGVIAYAAFRRFGGMDRATAMFSAMPGGLSVSSLLAEQSGAEVNRVILSHTARLVVLLVAAPILIQAITGIDLTAANRAAFNHAEALDPVRHGILILIAVASWAVARRAAFPSAMLLIPLATSAALHGTGLLTVHVPPLLSALAQVVVGGGVGARFAQYSVRQILRDGWMAAIVAAVLTVGALVGALAMARLTDVPIAPLFLAYLPGGAPELGVVALALGIDPAMVAAHHVLRVLLIIAALPLLARALVGRDEDGRGR